jgi:hypothetical protein
VLVESLGNTAVRQQNGFIAAIHSQQARVVEVGAADRDGKRDGNAS